MAGALPAPAPPTVLQQRRCSGGGGCCCRRCGSHPRRQRRRGAGGRAGRGCRREAAAACGRRSRLVNDGAIITGAARTGGNDFVRPRGRNKSRIWWRVAGAWCCASRALAGDADAVELRRRRSEHLLSSNGTQHTPHHGTLSPLSQHTQRSQKSHKRRDESITQITNLSPITLSLTSHSSSRLFASASDSSGSLSAGPLYDLWSCFPP